MVELILYPMYNYCVGACDDARLCFKYDIQILTYGVCLSRSCLFHVQQPPVNMSLLLPTPLLHADDPIYWRSGTTMQLRSLTRHISQYRHRYCHLRQYSFDGPFHYTRTVASRIRTNICTYRFVRTKNYVLRSFNLHIQQL